jgi:hypothetical protein
MHASLSCSIIALLCAPACGSDQPSPLDASPLSGRRVAVAWDDASAVTGGMLRGFSALPPWGFVTPPHSIGAGATVRYAAGRLFIASAAQGTLTTFDPDAWAPLQVYNLGPGSAPQDVAVANLQRAYATRQTASHLQRVNLDTGASTEVVDLRPLCGGGEIQQRMMAIHEGRLFVQIVCPDSTGRLAVMDLATEQLIDVDPDQPGVQAIALQGRAPRFKMQVWPARRRLYLSATGDFFDAGGLEVIDLDALRSEGLAIRESDGMVGADMGAFRLVRDDRGFLTFSTDFALSSHLVPFMLPSGKTGPEAFVTLGYFVPVILHDPAADLLFLPAAGGVPPGAYVFDAVTGASLGDVRLPLSGVPTDLAFYDSGCLQPGDLNEDGRLDAEDLQGFVNCVLSSGSRCGCADLDADGDVGLGDIPLFADRVLGQQPIGS